jgi:hypothetical protein
MKVKSIHYPDGCQLQGWDKIVFERRIKQTFRPFFSVCELDRCRAAIQGSGRDNDRYNELDAFHCESFGNMSAAEAHALVDKAAQYIGVRITLADDSWMPSVPVAFFGGIVIGAILTFSVSLASPTRSVTPVVREGGYAHVDTFPTILPSTTAQETPAPILTAIVRTNNPAATARLLASTVRSGPGEYEVSLSVTPVDVADDQLVAPDLIQPLSRVVERN